MDDRILELLYRSFDDRLTEEEARELSEAMKASPELAGERERIAAMRDALSRGAPASFGPFFPEKVMRRIRELKEGTAEEDPFWESLFPLFRRVALAGAVVSLVLIAYNLKTSETISLAAAFAAPEMTMEDLMESPIEQALELSR